MSCHSTHVGIAATRHARAVTDLDEAQVASIFHRLKNTYKDAQAPTIEEGLATLTRIRREALDDPRLDAVTAHAIAERYTHALQAIQCGQIPDGRTWAAMQHTVLEAEIAERNLNALTRSSARHQRKNEDRMAAIFRRWRRTSDYEDLESPDPAFLLDERQYPGDKHTRRALRKMGFENYLAQRLPVFTYGTLRNGQHNAHLTDGAVTSRSEDAHIDGVAVYGPSWGFPYAVEAPDSHSMTKGDLVYLADDHDGDWARQRLDTLEGFNSDQFGDSHYRRVTHEVTYTDTTTGHQTTTKAWVYLAGRHATQQLSESDRIHDGDWVKAKNDHQTHRDTRKAHAKDSDTSSGSGWNGAYVTRKRAVDPVPERSAADSAAVFRSAGMFGD